MNHKVLAIAPIVAVAALALTAVGFAIPQQALAGGHHHNHNSNSIKVDEQINHLNNCTGPSLQRDMSAAAVRISQPSTDCQNFGDNQADISKLIVVITGSSTPPTSRSEAI